MKHIAILTFAITSLTGCMTLPVQGDIGNGKEKFLGEATGFVTGSGKLSIRSQDGVQCDGKFKYSSSRVTGTGTFTCNDGREGIFDFTSNRTQGKGFGKTTKGEPFRFTFGYPDSRVEKW